MATKADMLIDIHTHSPKHQRNTIEVKVLDPKCEYEDNSCFFCYGIHPWFIDDINFVNFESKLRKTRGNSKFFALGEVGLDKACKTDFELQLDTFRKQVSLAISLKINLIILHIVRAHHECINVLKEENYQGKILIHDFRANTKVFTEYNKNFETYISLGPKSLTSSKAKLLANSTPIHRTFLETDDSTTFNINQVYKLYESLTSVSRKESTFQFNANWNSLQ